MTQYKVVNINLLHNGQVYPSGSVVDLNEAQASYLKQHLEPVEEQPKKHNDDKDVQNDNDDYDAMTTAELKKLVEEKGIEVTPSGQSGRPIKADYIEALKK